MELHALQHCTAAHFRRRGMGQGGTNARVDAYPQPAVPSSVPERGSATWDEGASRRTGEGLQPAYRFRRPRHCALLPLELQAQLAALGATGGIARR
jgi:hypothetical protein